MEHIYIPNINIMSIMYNTDDGEKKISPNLTLYVSKEEQERLKKLANKDHRSMSKELSFLMDFYETNKDKVIL